MTLYVSSTVFKISLCANINIKYVMKLTTTSLIIVEPGSKDIGLNDTLPIASDILWYQLIPPRQQ
jgi:hypothetical protein